MANIHPIIVVVTAARAYAQDLETAADKIEGQRPGNYGAMMARERRNKAEQIQDCCKQIEEAVNAEG